MVPYWFIASFLPRIFGISGARGEKDIFMQVEILTYGK